jgi:CubicO group peptidase (beta-lactamase class C family)
LIEKVTGEAEDVDVQRNVFAPLRMRDTRYRPAAKSCGPHTMRGAAIGWDIDTAQSTTQGMIFPFGSFGHTGFTGTSLWLDPGSDTYVVLLTPSLCEAVRRSPDLRGAVATAVARALRLYGSR